MKKIVILSTLLGVLMLLSACSEKTETNVSSTDIAATQVIAQEPTRTAEMYGQVKSIIGNEATLLLAEQQTNIELSDAEKEKKKSEMQSLSEEERQKFRSEQIKFTGESAVIIIPVGTPITSSQSANNPQSLKELSLTDIRDGVFLRIWLEGDGSGDELSTEYVRVLQFQQ